MLFGFPSKEARERRKCKKEMNLKEVWRRKVNDKRVSRLRCGAETRENFWLSEGKELESGLNTSIEVRKRLFSLGIIIIVVSSSSYNVMLSVYIHIILCTCFTLHTIFSLYCYYLSTSKWEKVETSQFFSFSLYTVFASTRSKI